MTGDINPRQLTGQDESHLVSLPDGHRLQADAAAAFAALQTDALAAGFELAIASSFRSFSRQLTLWNGKASGERPVHDDRGEAVNLAALSRAGKMHAILRFSALPGTSRHHWGTDVDVFDAAAVPAGYALQLVPPEVATGGIFDPLHCWLDARMQAGQSHGFYRPYGVDRGGVAPERWHLSYAPAALPWAAQFGAHLLPPCWDCAQADAGLSLREEVEAELPQLVRRYMMVPADGWARGG